MNPDNYGTRDACKRLVDAEIVLETERVWFFSSTGWELVARNPAHPVDRHYLPAPSMSEAWRELKRRKITSINMTVANDGEDTIITHYDYPVKDGHRIMIPTRFKNANPADAAIDLLIWIRKEIDP